MRCNICDSSIEKPVFNKQIDTWEPCGTCLEVIFNVFEDAPEYEPSEEEIEEEVLELEIENV